MRSVYHDILKLLLWNKNVFNQILTTFSINSFSKQHDLELKRYDRQALYGFPDCVPLYCYTNVKYLFTVTKVPSGKQAHNITRWPVWGSVAAQVIVST